MNAAIMRKKLFDGSQVPIIKGLEVANDSAFVFVKVNNLPSTLLRLEADLPKHRAPQVLLGPNKLSSLFG